MSWTTHISLNFFHKAYLNRRSSAIKLSFHQHARTTIAGILKHIREVHPFFRDAITCGLDGCAATPSSYEALKAHVYRYHKNLLTTTQY